MKKKIMGTVFQDNIQKCAKVYDNLPEKFSSNQFLELLRREGVNQQFIKRNQYVRFLISYADQITNRTWLKIIDKSYLKHCPETDNESNKPQVSYAELAPKKVEQPVVLSLEQKIEDAITLLKANGYKILKLEYIKQ